jgi:hypothetical protein
VIGHTREKKHSPLGRHILICHFLIGSCIDFHTVCWAADNDSTVSMCMFLTTRWTSPCVKRKSGGSCVGDFLFGLWPFLVCFAVVSCWRNANLAGEFACRRVCCLSQCKDRASGNRKKTTKQETQQKKPKTEQAKRHYFVVSLDVAVFAIIHTSITRF